MQSYIHNVLLALDKLLNALFGGDPQETVTQRLGKMASLGSLRATVACWVIGKVFFRNTKHCADSLEEDDD